MQVMKWSVIALAVAAGTSQLAFASAQSDSKGFVEDGSLILKNRNFYYNLDDRSSNTPGESKQSYSEEWAHAIITNFESGFTEGTVGFGVDAYGMFGVKLDSGGGRAGTGLLPADSDGGSQDNYGEAGGAVKARISNTVLKYGEMETAFPVFDTADSRLLPETTTGFLLTSNEIENLEVNAGHFTAFNNRASTNSADITSGYAGVMDGSFDFVGGSYTVNDDLSFSLYGSELEDTWRQYYGNATYGIPFSDTSSLGFNLNVYHTADHGDENLGDISATFWSLATTYSLGAHAFTVAYQRNNGDTPFDYIGGDSIYVASSYWSDFNAPNERSWQVRYDVDLGEYVVPGLKAYAAYVRGDDIESSDNAAYAAAGWSDMDDAKHFERVLGTSYTVQEGAVKDLSFTLIHNMHRGSGGQIDGDIDRVRLIVEYPLEIL